MIRAYILYAYLTYGMKTLYEMCRVPSSGFPTKHRHILHHDGHMFICQKVKNLQNYTVRLKDTFSRRRFKTRNLLHQAKLHASLRTSRGHEFQGHRVRMLTRPCKLPKTYEPRHEKTNVLVPTRSDTNQVVQVQKMARGLKFRI